MQPVVQLLQYLYKVLDSKLRKSPRGDTFQVVDRILDGGILTPRHGAGSSGPRSPACSPKVRRSGSIPGMEPFILPGNSASCRRRAQTGGAPPSDRVGFGARTSIAVRELGRKSVKPMRGVIRNTLPAPAQRSQLPRRLQGDPRIAPARKESLEAALRRSHAAGAEAFLKGRAATDPAAARGGWLKGSFVPVGALPMLMVVPSCLACDSTRSIFALLTVLPFLCMMAMTLISKPACDYDV